MAQGNRSLLNWLVAGKDMPYADWLKHKRSPEEIEAAWRALATTAGPPLSLSDLPGEAPTPLASTAVSAASLSALAAPRTMAAGWRIGSFSSLQHGADSEASASDHDGRAVPALPAVSGPPADIGPDDILLFARGPAAGDCVHALFERIDFADPGRWPAVIDEVLASHPLSPAGPPDGDSARRPARMLRRLLDDVLATSLPGGIVLSTVGRRQRLVELGFNLPAGLTAPRLNDWLAAHGYPLPRLGFPPLDGYLKGFIDLVFCHANRFHVLDWKSNHLGFAAADYGQQQVAAAMAEHGYHLQYLIYCVALHRYLRCRIADYDYDRHFGGVYYLFVRGVRPDWHALGADGKRVACGVYHHRPPRSTIESLDSLLSHRSLANHA